MHDYEWQTKEGIKRIIGDLGEVIKNWLEERGLDYQYDGCNYGGPSMTFRFKISDAGDNQIRRARFLANAPKDLFTRYWWTNRKRASKVRVIDVRPLDRYSYVIKQDDGKVVYCDHDYIDWERPEYD